MVGYLVEPYIDKSSFDVKPSENAKRALAKGIIVGSISLLAYVLVVVVTTPSIPAGVAIKIAFTVNSIVMIGISVGIGAQVFLSSRSEERRVGKECRNWGVVDDVKRSMLVRC